MSDDPSAGSAADISRRAMADSLRTAMGRVGVWSAAFQLNDAAAERTALEALEDLGYRSLWIPERYGGKEVFSHAAFLLGCSRHAVICTGVANIWVRDAMAMVNGGRMLYEAFPGRFILGIGVSSAPTVVLRGGTYDRPLERMSAYLDEMEAATYTGSATQIPPWILGALGPRMMEMAARRTDGAHTYFVPVEHTRVARAALGPDRLLIVEQAAVLGESAEAARAIARGYAEFYLARDNYAGNLRRLGWSEEDLAGGGSDELLDAVVARGDVEVVADRVRAHLDAGADHVCLQLLRNDPADLCLDQYEALASALLEAP